MNIELLMENSLRVFTKSGILLVELFPYVLAGVLIGEALKYVSWTKIVSRACNSHPVLAISVAAALGTVSPLCTYGTIPIVLRLLKIGTPFSVIITFLSASSLMNPQLFILTWGGVNPEMAIARLAAVLVFGFLLGIAVLKISSPSITKPEIFNGEPNNKRNCKINLSGFNKSEYLHSTWSTLQFIGYYLLIGVILSSFIEVFIPGRWIYMLFNPGEWFAVPLAAILGIPLYACGGGTIPLIRSLLLGGMAKGSALAFFIVGPATRITPLMAMATVVRPKFISIYVISIIIFSLLAGFVYK
jgi:uncharacterized membrane protein YraQ (UPF0718 family)